MSDIKALHSPPAPPPLFFPPSEPEQTSSVQSPASSPSLIHILPAELLLEIFSHASAHSQATYLSVLLTCKYVYTLVHPAPYSSWAAGKYGVSVLGRSSEEGDMDGIGVDPVGRLNGQCLRRVPVVLGDLVAFDSFVGWLGLRGSRRRRVSGGHSSGKEHGSTNVKGSPAQCSNMDGSHGCHDDDMGRKDIGKMVRYLWLVDVGYAQRSGHVEAIIEACPNIRALACTMHTLEKICSGHPGGGTRGTTTAPQTMARNVNPLNLLDERRRGGPETSHTAVDDALASSHEKTPTPSSAQPQLHPLLHTQVTHLSIIESHHTWGSLSAQPHGPAFLSNITHLRLCTSLTPDFPIASFSALTHIAFSTRPLRDFIGRHLARLKPLTTLKVIVVVTLWWREEVSRSELAEIGRMDERVVVCKCRRDWKEEDVWRELTEVELDEDKGGLWKRAERQRRAERILEKVVKEAL